MVLGLGILLDEGLGGAYGLAEVGPLRLVLQQHAVIEGSFAQLAVGGGVRGSAAEG